ncbi:MAG: RHS repeat-associated core domain-containing protein [Thermoanaerobaculia bacterium]
MTSCLRRCLVLLLAAAAPVWADVHPNTAGGFPVDQSFHVGDIDNVNPFNGALTVTIPLGPSYPVNGGFSYSLKLVANSSPWIFQTVHSPNPKTGQDTTYIQANPNPCSNAGLGWRVSLGRFNPPCQVPDSNNVLPGPVYQDEMGTDHVFYPTLHAGDPEDASVSGITDVEYTRDGSYLRLKVYGNLTNISGTSGRATPTSSATNRLNGAGTVYDAAGNLTNWNGAVYKYDHFNQMTDMTSGSEHAFYIYTADDERVWSYDLVRNVSHWTLRDLGGKVLRDYVNNNGAWGLQSDYLYRDSLLLAAETAAGQFHYHLDHLGTPRLITTISGTQAAYHAYYPFGEEATAFNQDTERMKFTGHERDLASPNGPGDDLDYMHARHESPVTGRFLSVDPSQAGQDPNIPISWNRYAYALGNPLKYIDPNGMVYKCPRSGCPSWVVPKTFWQKMSFEASFLPGPSVITAGSAVASSLIAGAEGGEAVISTGSRIASIDSKLANIFTKNLTNATAEAAARESLGEVVAQKVTGEAFDHVEKYETARAGATRALDTLKRLVSDPRPQDAERSFAQYLLTKYSKTLDAIEKVYNLALAAATSTPR